jgi:hypothetical protein
VVGDIALEASVTPGDALTALAARLRAERAAARILVGLGLGVCYGGIVRSAVPVVLGLVLGVVAAAATDRFRRIRPEAVAQHLDRHLPELEESSWLLLHPTGDLSPLASLQRARVAERWNEQRVRRAIPHRELRWTLAACAALSVLGLGASRVPRMSPPPAPAAGPATGESARIRSVTLDITPPEYTGDERRRVAATDVEVDEGALVVWDVEVEGPITDVWVVGLGSESLPMRRASGSRWQAGMRGIHSQLFQVGARTAGGTKSRSADIRLAVRSDLPPTVTVLRPPERTVLDPASPSPVPVEALARDDYGVDSVVLEATIAMGHGEAVRFRRLRLPLRRREGPDRRSIIISGIVDPSRLGMGPGDELYFGITATDHRAPLPNRTESATRFIAIRDTASSPQAELTGMAMGAQPEYFRSERQLIIDTEKLLSDRPRLPVARFRERSNDLGADQGLLRLRYGQFLGEESEEAEGAPGSEVHEHDSPENATLLSRTVKDKLRAAVGAMWSAELHLRTAEPGQALPYEHRALELIKQIQQQARVYVQRVGFAPAPIEVAKIRLTGKLDGVRDQYRATEVERHDTLDAVRQALRLLAEPDPKRDAVAQALEAAGGEVGPLAVRDPRFLPILGHLRGAIDTLHVGRDCRPCLDRVERALWAVLPEPAPVAPSSYTGISPVRRRFEALLRRPAP